MNEKRPPVQQTSKSREFNIVIHGEKSNDAKVVGETLAACDALWRSVCEEVTGDPDAVKLSVVAFGYRCDGCGRKVKKLPRTWVKDGADDLCPKCAALRKAPSGST